MSNDLRSAPPTRSGRGTHFAGSAREIRALASFVKLMRATHWASLRAGRVREEAGFTEGQFGVLEALFHLGPLDQSQLKSKLLTSPANLSVVIDNLERAGLVTRRPHPNDRRRRIVHLAPSGRRAVARLMPRHASRIAEVMSGLSAREQDELARLCRKLGRWSEEMS